MLDLNLSAKLTEIKDLINIWNRTYLTPIGKVTVIKTFFLAKLNYLFLSLPNPNDIYFYLGFYVAFNTVQVISRRVVGRAEETST